MEEVGLIEDQALNATNEEEEEVFEVVEVVAIVALMIEDSEEAGVAIEEEEEEEVVLQYEKTLVDDKTLEDVIISQTETTALEIERTQDLEAETLEIEINNTATDFSLNKVSSQVQIHQKTSELQTTEI